MFVLTNAWRAVTRSRAISALTVLVTLLVSFGTITSLALLQENDTAHGADYEAQTPNAVIRPTAATTASMKGDDAKSTTAHYLAFDDYTPYAVAAQEQNVTFTYTFMETLPVRQTDSIKAVAGSADASADKTGGEFQLRGFYDDKAKAVNDYGQYRLVEGKNLTYTDVSFKGALISKTVADKNGLKVGDKFKVGDPVKKDKTYEFTVQGIYEYTGDGQGSAKTSKLAKENRENVIYAAYATTYTYGLEPEDSSAAKGTWAMPDLDIVFDFTDVATYDKFTSLVEKKKLPKGYEITSPSLASYKASIAPLADAADRARPVLWALAVGGCVVLLALTVARTWAGRTDEIGMALVSGVTRPRLGWQFMVETFILTVVPAAIGLVAGGFAAGPLGAALAGGHATPVTSTIAWTLAWNAVGVLAVLAVVAMLRPATFGNGNLFKASNDSEVQA